MGSFEDDACWYSCTTLVCFKVPGLNAGMPTAYESRRPVGAGCFADYPCRYSSASLAQYERAAPKPSNMVEGYEA